MSSEIYYHQISVRIPASHAGAAEDLYLQMAQAGSSNCFEMSNHGGPGRRSRSWQAVAFGTAKEVLTTGIQIAGHTAGGMVRMGTKANVVTPETWIRKVRKLLSEAAKTDLSTFGVSINGIPVKPEIVWRTGSEEQTVDSSTYDIQSPGGFKAFYARYLAENGSKLYAHSFFKVRGPELR